LGIPLCLLLRRVGGVAMSAPFTLCYDLRYVAMILRYYDDVVYKLILSYKRYFLYYAFIGAGYLLGALLFVKTGLWPLAILTGEAAGVLFAFLTEKKLHHAILRPTGAFWRTVKIILILTASEGLAALIFNADRLMLKLLIGPTAVTVYYLATLVGKTITLLTGPLNGVLLGYLARYEGGLTRRMMHVFLFASLVMILAFTAVCTVGGLLMLVLLYPAELEAVRPYLLIGSLGQVLFFTASVLTVVLVRFAKKSYQIYINGIFGLCFFGLGIPATALHGVWGFAISMVISGTVRWLIAILLGYRLALTKQKA
jgi:O-antigen/teichoic acid export membrane protein